MWIPGSSFMSPTVLMTQVYIFIPNLSPELWNLLLINNWDSLQASQNQSFPNCTHFLPFHTTIQNYNLTQTLHFWNFTGHQIPYFYENNVPWLLPLSPFKTRTSVFVLAYTFFHLYGKKTKQNKTTQLIISIYHMEFHKYIPYMAY